MKGLAAGLGCAALATEATELEHAATAQDRDNARARLARLASVLEPLLRGLREHFGRPADRVGTVQVASEAPRGAAPEWLPRLRELLEQGDFDAREFWNEHRDEAARWLPVQTAQRVALALDNFEFDAALTHLNDDAGRPPMEQ